eukprot:PhM_4_TR3452/c1_g1_i1/m.62876
MGCLQSHSQIINNNNNNNFTSSPFPCPLRHEVGEGEEENTQIKKFLSRRPPPLRLGTTPEPKQKQLQLKGNQSPQRRRDSLVKHRPKNDSSTTPSSSVMASPYLLFDCVPPPSSYGVVSDVTTDDAAFSPTNTTTPLRVECL